MREVKYIKDMPAIVSRPDITAKVYSVSPSYQGADFVRISACYAPDRHGEPETFAFKCDPDGDVLDWFELPCSVTGTYNHEAIAEKIRNS